MKTFKDSVMTVVGCAAFFAVLVGVFLAVH